MNTYLSHPSSLSFHSMPEPPSSITYHNHVNNNRDLALQTYLALHSQHESLIQHLDELRPSSPSTSPTRSGPHHSHDGGRSSPLPRQRQRSGFGCMSATATATASTFGGSSSSLVGSSALDDQTTLLHHAAEVALEEAKLCDVNEGIKRTLTELLNCEATRGEGNRQFRSWVQGRLMEAERELRRGRRRRSAGSACGGE
ncbi:hypothetical protein GE21DRAFT_8505 [Neurospora crassa]|uniref:Uncharacterized protein n=2 Tax=Neurospora crassa TaxID=5141 RepID=Q1K5W0_NEUCR|nr:hypothetical protein NCU07178 [Neurospora crassa OR74A]EAA28167.1 hypothetical protein NCU07178 [Neurospora crassa OR74A]KHE85793.1 hypothetical protein GE21DRAFT_8505 [Neurospora crassa]CAD71105.1 putative protein [Neurospora crassa]|eukprot:XP_957403.1 hypothetical protein NCU07178 [Neurospora crassa OR74A]